MLSSLICSLFHTVSLSLSLFSLTHFPLVSLDGVGLGVELCGKLLQECSKPYVSLSEPLLLLLLHASLSGSCEYNPNPVANVNNGQEK